MFRIHLDIQKSAITSCGYCPDSQQDEAQTITKYNKFGKALLNGICLGLDEIDTLLSIRSDLDSLKTIFPAKKAAEESSPRIPQQEASSRAISYQPPTPQPQASTYKQAAVSHPEMYSIKQPPPSPPAGSRQLYQCQEAVPLRDYPQERISFIH
ncbi:unnamed protein product [Mytilus coruscus]|uniref:Uncharacterized protein n=1 Tax=Mytilus coruscus TaxID=42192 RepID=A0A6J8D0C6_MYTCO|nr:unnamed protein product [Mytilus coruscus]